MDEDERMLVVRAQQGDQRAFEALVSRYDRRVLGLAYDMAGDSEDARDIFQETFLAAYRALSGFRMESDFFTWLYRIAVNKALTFRRRNARQRASVLREGDLPEAQALTGGVPDTPEEVVLRAELERQIEAALSALSPQERMAFALCHRQGFKVRQAAAFMRCSEGAVKSYLFRAREKAKAALRNYMD